MKRQAFSQRQANTVLFIAVLMILIVVPLVETAATLLLPEEAWALVSPVTEVLFLLLPLILFFIFSKVELKSALRIHCFSIKNLICVFVMAVCGYIVISGITGSLIALVYATGGGIPDSTGVSQIAEQSPWLYLILLVVITPLFEEFFVRGALLSGYQEMGKTRAALLTALLFGLLHGNLVMLPSTFLIGVLLAYIVIGTGSIWLTVFYHAVHNLFACTGWIDQYVMQLPWTLGLMPGIETSAGMQLYGVYALVLWIAAALILGVLFYRMVRKAKRVELAKAEHTQKKTWYGFFIAALCILCVMVLLTTAMYYMI